MDLTPSGFYRWSREFSGEPAVISYGVPRSGSTFVWQVLCDLLPDGGVVKTHHYLDCPGVPAVATYRDWRDVVASQFRCSSETRGAVMRQEDLCRLAGQCHEWAMYFRRYKRCGALTICYEHMHAEPVATIIRIARHVGISASFERCESIAEAHSLEVNRAIAANLTDAHDPATLLHPRHIHTGAQGTWQEFISESDWPLLHEVLGPLLREFGYST